MRPAAKRYLYHLPIAPPQYSQQPEASGVVVAPHKGQMTAVLGAAAADLMDLKARLSRMVIAYSYDGRPVTAHDIGADGAMALRDRKSVV